MADMCTSMVGLAGAGAKLALVLFQIADSIGSAGKEAQAVATEVSLFSQSLTAVSRCLEKKSDEQTALRRIALVVTEACESLLDDLRAVLKYLVTSPGSNFAAYCGRVQWILRRPKVNAMRRSVESFKSTLVLLIATMDSVEATHHQAPDTILELLKVQVESLLKVSETAVQSVQSLPTLGGQGESPSPVETGTTVDSTLSIDSGDRSTLADPTIRAEGREVLSDKATAAYLVNEDHYPGVGPGNDLLEQAVIGISRTEAAQLYHHGMTGTGSTEAGPIDMLSDPSHTRTLVLKTNVMVHKLTQRVLSRPNPSSEWSWEGANSAQRKADRKELKHPDPDGMPKPKSKYAFQRSAQVASTTANSTTQATAEEELSEASSSVDYDEDPDELKDDTADQETGSVLSLEPEHQFSEASISALSDRIAGMFEDTMVNQIAKLQAAKTAAEMEAERLRPGDDMLKAPIRFKDAVGRKFSFPWHLCKTWKGMEALIQQAFLHVDVIGRHVHEGHYDLVGPDGEIILPQVYESMVQPDWTITMHMWPLPEPLNYGPMPPPSLIAAPPPIAIPPPRSSTYKGSGSGKGSSKPAKMIEPPPLPPPMMGALPPPLFPTLQVENRKKSRKNWLPTPVSWFSRSGERSNPTTEASSTY